MDTNYRPQAVHDPSPGGLSLSFGYDAVGDITDLRDGIGSTVLARYGYDTLGRLTQTQDGPTGTPIETYAYDVTGNRTSLTASTGTESYTYLPDSHRLAAVNGATRNYDAAGNTVSLDGKELAYNDANRMSQIKEAGEVVEAYSYNHRGERILRSPSSGEAQVTLYDEVGQWLGNYTESGRPLQEAIWLDNYPVALMSVSPNDAPALAYIQPDSLGTPRVVIDPLRNVAIWNWVNNGEVFGFESPNEDPDRDGNVLNLALRFPGQQATDAGGLFYNYQRDFDPATGRYSQSDPIGLRGGISTYSYVSAKPTRLTDPCGLQSRAALRPRYGYVAPYDPDMPAGAGTYGGPSVERMFPAFEMSASMLNAQQWLNPSSANWMFAKAITGQFSKKDGSSSRPNDCPSGTLPIDKAKRKFGFGHGDLEAIKRGAGAKPNTWTGIAPNGDIWVGTQDGSGRHEGNIEDYGFGEER